jgi:hypothetical protein
MNGLVFGKLRSYLLQFGFLLVTREGDMASLVGSDALFEGGVVEITTAPEDFIQRSLLGGSRAEFLFKCLAHCWLFHV